MNIKRGFLPYHNIEIDLQNTHLDFSSLINRLLQIIKSRGKLKFSLKECIGDLKTSRKRAINEAKIIDDEIPDSDGRWIFCNSKQNIAELVKN